MNLNVQYSTVSRHSGKVELVILMFIFVVVVGTIFLSSGADGMSYPVLSPILKCKPKVGVVKGIINSPSGSCALINETIVHANDTIHNISIVGIQGDTVQFAKDGVTWHQAIQEAPNSAWPN